MVVSQSRACVTLTVGVMYEQWEPGIAPGAGPMANPLPSGRDWQAISWAEYGVKVGIDALLDLFDEVGVQSTIFASGIIGESHPETIQAIVQRGHELAAHGWAQNIIPATRDATEERTDVQRTFAALARAGGKPPVGWLSPRCTPSDRTAGLVVGEGGLWFGDVFDADMPYLKATAAGDICAVPFTTDVNDLPMTIRYGRPIECLLEELRAAIDARLVMERPSMLDLTVHAHVGGRPRGIATLRHAFEFLRQTAGVRIKTKKDVAEEFLQQRPKGRSSSPIPNS